MKLQTIKNVSKKGFTLIELLVVITIIGILATGATSTYTSQIQKARDTTRINDIMALRSGIEMVYQDSMEYPHSDEFFTVMNPYVEKLPADSKHGQPGNDTADTGHAQDLGYAYIVGEDNNGILYGEYEVSTAFENSGNVTKKADTDGGGTDGEKNRYEIGLDIANNITAVAENGITPKAGACTLGGDDAANTTDLIVINGNPTGSDQCD